jgi:hypothetical protein
VLFVEHSRTSLKCGRSEVWPTVMYGGSRNEDAVDGVSLEGKAHNHSHYINALMFLRT